MRQVLLSTLVALGLLVAGEAATNLLPVRVRIDGGASRVQIAIDGSQHMVTLPNLGQGAGMAIANASALGAALDEITDVPDALRRWETLRRPLTEEVQRWSYRYGLIFYALPFGGLFGEQIRVGIMSMIGRGKFTARKLSWLRHGGHSIA